MTETVEPPALQFVELFTDGACQGNPGPGGWGVVLRSGKHEKTLAGGERLTTNNRMELLAAISGLEALTRRCKVRLVTDSRYVKDGLTQWLPGWQRRGWQTSNRQPVKNVDLWRRLAAVAARHDLELVWVRGHTGHPENEWADRLAREAVKQVLRQPGPKDLNANEEPN
jgi:ribonuclease HI